MFFGNAHLWPMAKLNVGNSLIFHEMFRQLLLAVDVFVRNTHVKMISACIP